MLDLLREAFSNPEIAERLGISRAGAPTTSPRYLEAPGELALRGRDVEASGSTVATCLTSGFLVTALRSYSSAAIGRAARIAVPATAAAALGLLAFGVFEMRGRDREAVDGTAIAQADAEPTATPSIEQSDNPLMGPSATA